MSNIIQQNITPKSKKHGHQKKVLRIAVILGVVAIVILGGYLAWQWWPKDANNQTSCAPQSDIELLKGARDGLNEGDVTKLEPAVTKIKGITCSEENVDYLYILVQRSIILGDSQTSQQYLDKLTTFYKDKTFNAELGSSLDSLENIKAKVAQISKKDSGNLQTDTTWTPSYAQ